MLTRWKESNTYLASVRRYCWRKERAWWKYM